MKLNKKDGLFVFMFFCLLIPSWSWALEVEAITKPSADIMLSFVNGGRVAEVFVKEGDIVKKDQSIARQEDEIEQLQLKQWEENAQNMAKIDAVEAELAQKRQDLTKLEWARQKGAVTEWEIDHAKLAILTSEITLRQAEFELEQAKLQRDELKAKLKLLNIKTPIDGQVEEVLIEKGESAQPLNPVIRVVKIDPLWLDVPVPISEAVTMKNNQKVPVRIEKWGESNSNESSMAKIVNIFAVADAASDTLRIRLELPNPKRRPAGERVSVVFDTTKKE